MSVPTENFNEVNLIQDCREEDKRTPGDDVCVAVMFLDKLHETPYQLVKLNKDATGQHSGTYQTRKVQNCRGETDQFKGGFRVDQNRFFCVTRYQMSVFELEDLKELTTIKLQDVILEGIEFAHSLKWRGGNRFLVNSTIYHEAALIKDENFTYCEIGSGVDYECITWIAKCELNIDDVQLRC